MKKDDANNHYNGAVNCGISRYIYILHKGRI